MKFDYSIIIPAYNEGARIGKALGDIVDALEANAWLAEVIVVNDGSRDDTAAIVNSFSAKYSYIHLLDNKRNFGKGYSVRNGMLRALAPIVMFTDADLSAPMGEAGLLFAAIRQGADIAIGSRWLDRSRQTVHQPLYRRFFGRCFNAVTRLVMRLPFADTQCGFKAFTREAAQAIFSLQRIQRWGFDPEILFIALKLGYKVREVPVTWGHDERSRISYLRDGIKMLEELVYIRWNQLTGAYRRPVKPMKSELRPNGSGF